MIRTTAHRWIGLALLCTAASDAHAQVGATARILIEEGLVAEAEGLGLSAVARSMVVRQVGSGMAAAELDVLAARSGATMRLIGEDGRLASGFQLDLLHEQTTRVARGITDRAVANVLGSLPRNASERDITAALRTQLVRSAHAAEGRGLGRSLEFDPGNGSFTIGLDSRLAGVKLDKATIPVYKSVAGGLAAAGGCEGIVRRVRPDVPSGESACVLALRGDLAPGTRGK